MIHLLRNFPHQAHLWRNIIHNLELRCKTVNHCEKSVFFPVDAYKTRKYAEIYLCLLSNSWEYNILLGDITFFNCSSYTFFIFRCFQRIYLALLVNIAVPSGDNVLFTCVYMSEKSIFKIHFAILIYTIPIMQYYICKMYYIINVDSEIKQRGSSHSPLIILYRLRLLIDNVTIGETGSWVFKMLSSLTF